MPSTPSFRFREALPIAMVVGVVAIGTVVGFRQAGATSVQEIRTAYGQIKSREDAPQLLLERLNRTNREDVAAEYLLLMAAVGFRSPDELLEPLVSRRYHEGSTERSQMILTALRARVRARTDREDFQKAGYASLTLAETYPHDFAAQWLFVARAYDIGTPAPERAKQVMVRAEELTDNHPAAVLYRALFEEYAEPIQEKTEPLVRALHGFKLYEYARATTGRKPDRQESIKFLTGWLHGKNVPPTEPSASEYLAIKRRGWGFTPQMIEPFEKLN